MKVAISLNEMTSKFEGKVNGKVVTQSGDRKRVVNVLSQRTGLTTKQINDLVSGGTAAVVESKLHVEKSEFSVEERFQFIQQFVGLIAKKSIHSLILTGDGGLGKTYTVIESLKKLGLREDTIGEIDGDFVVIKGYSTAKYMYRTLWENNGKVIVVDDADAIFKDPIGANLLKSALESSDKRVVTWGAEFSDKEELPNRFDFHGRIIFISNLPQCKFPQALLSRSMRVDLTLSTEEKVDRIEQVLNEQGRSTEVGDVIKFIKKYASRSTDLNVRSGLSVLKLRREFGSNFERIALYNFTA